MKNKQDDEKTAEEINRDDDDIDEGLLTSCPYCNHEYDEIDYEYQRCHYCKHSAN